MTHAEIINVLKEFKDKNSEKYGILELGLFGSTARGNSVETSDVDIFLKTKTPDPFLITHIKEDLESQLHKHVDIVRLRDKMNPYLKKQIERDAVYV